jgi:hypothetical protein
MLGKSLAAVGRIGEGRRPASRRRVIRRTPRGLRRAQNPYFALWRARNGQSRPF